MKKTLLLLMVVLTTISVYPQNITVSGTSVTGRFNSCSGNNTPNVSVTFLSGSGTSVVGGNLVCNDPCGSTTLRVTISNIRWNQSPNTEWLHGLFFPSNSGYVVSGIALPPGFITYNAGCTGMCPVGITSGPGFYYDASAASWCCSNVILNDGLPCNNYGDVSINCGSNFSIQFDLNFCNSNLSANTETFILRGTSDGATGCWQYNDNILHNISFTINTQPCAPVNSIPVTAGPIVNTCVGNTPNYTAELTGGCGNGSTITWWNSATGGSLLGSGSPFVYDPPGSNCPGGTTLWASCCSGGATTCVNRTPVTIAGSCNSLTLLAVSSTNGNCITPGSINSVSVSNSQGAVTYTINPGNVSNGTGLFNGLTGSIYTVSASDASGCIVSSIVNFNQPPIVTLTASAIQPLCNGGNGSLTFSASGGTGIINYTINGTPTTSPNVQSAGTYTILATDANGCTSQSIQTITDPAVLSLTSNASDPLCNGGNGNLTFSASGGTGTVNFTVNGVAATSPSIQPAGNYTITATDQNGCTTTTQLTIGEPNALTWLTTTSTSVNCNGGTDGTITSQATGGTGTISYTLQPTNQTNTTGSYSNLSANTYTITATDQNGCTTTTQIPVTEPSPLQITNIATTNPTCVPGNDGSLTISATGGTTNYQYSINGGALQTSNAFNNLGSGVYTIQVTDANGCTTNSTQNISAPNAPTFTTSTFTDVSCNGGTDGTITVQTTGGTNPINYNLQPTNQTNLSGSFTNLAANTYTVTATDLNGCSVQTQLTIAEPVILNWTSATGTDITCNGGSDGTITSQATGGTGSINYTLQPTNQTNTTGSYSNLAANTYTITATDQNGCTTTTQVTISEPSALTWLSTASTSVSCNGGNDGAITGQTTGGTGTINYLLQPTNQSSTSVSYNNLTAGTYTITATDQNGCTTTTQVTVTEPSPLQITNIASTNPTCVPGNDGSLTVSATGGTTNYQYSLNGGIQQASNTFSNLGSGVYTIQVSDANGCTATSTQNISAPNAPSFTTATSTDVSCNGGNDGTITVQTTGGTNPINYNLQPTNQTNLSGSFTNLAANTYTVTATDLNGCSVQTQLTIAEPVILNWTSATGTDITCNGGSDGTITSQATGGTGSINYTLQPTNQTNTTGSYSNLAANTYTITATDQNGCTTTTQVTISEPTPLSWTSATATNVSCNGGTDGTITSQAIGGTGSINYTLQPTNQTNTTGSYSNLAANTYTITATDQNGCTTTTQVTVTEPSPLQITNIASTNPTCVPGNDGSLTVSATGGTTNYQYSLNGGIQQASNTFSNLGSGVYTIQVSDANGCTTTSTQNISAPNAPSFTTATSTDVSCNGGNDGTITVQTTGGTNPINYNLQPTNQTNLSGSFTNLAANTYTVTATDLNGCSVQTQLTIAEPAILSWTSATGTDITCNGGSDGTITSQATGGTGSINYTLQPTNQTNTTGSYSNLSANTYTITATDQNGCTTTTQVTISEPTPLSWTSATATNVSCNGGTDGTITSQATGGTGTINYTLQPTNQTNTTGSYSNLAANTYTITATDQNGCTTTTQVTVTEPLPLQITNIASTNPTCVPGNDGSLTVSATGGTTNYQYSLNGGIQQASNTFSNLGSGVYTIQVTDANGCTTTSTQNISAPNAPSFTTATSTDVSCNGGNDGTITVQTTGGTNPINYNLQPTNQTNLSGSFTNLAANTYTVTATDLNGCSVQTQLTIAEPTVLSWTSATGTDITCNGGSDGTITSQATGGTGTINYTLQPTNQTNTTGSYSNLSANTYTITATDQNGCTTTTQVTISEPSALTWLSTASTSVSCNGGNDGAITGQTTGGTGTINYLLQPTNQSSTSVSYNNLTAGTYTITATDQNGCTTTTQVTVTEPLPLQITNIASTNPTCVPGNDGSLTVSATGGTTNYQYSLNGGIQQASNTFSNLGSGVYTIQVSDANGCTTTSTQNISAPNAPSFTIATSTDVSCNGGNDGTITVQTTGGTNPINYNLQPTNQTNLSGSFTNLAANTYTITATDLNGCSVQTQLTIAEPTVLSWTSATGTDITCNGGSDGTITSQATGGTGSINYTLQPTNQTNTTGSYSNLSANTYTITATDQNGCTTTTQVTISEPTPLSWTSATATNVSCNGGNDGTITSQAIGGTGSINYTLQPTNQTNTTGSYSNLAANTYTITATDQNGCTTTTQVTVTEPLPLQITNIASTNPTCVPGNDGSLTVSATGGTTNYQYSLNGGIQQASNTFSNLGSGVYTIQVSDANGCTATSTQNISAPNAPSFTTATSTDVSCNGGNDGTITVQTTGGTNPINYNLQPTNQTNLSGSFTNLAANTYTVTATDLNGCSVQTQLTIAEPVILNWTSATGTDITCNGGSDGTITSQATGGTGSINYTLQPTNQTNTTGSYSNLAANTYTITATDQNGCTTTTQVTISEPTPLSWTSATATNVSCNGGTDGTITSQAIGGTGSINYTLQPTNQTNTTGSYSNLAANTYTITATDQNGCTTTTQVTVTEPLPLQITNIASTNPTCVPGNDGSLTVSATGGTTNYQYSLNGGIQQASNTFSNLGSGVYTIQVSDANGCTATSTQNISAPNAPSFTTATSTDVSCNGGNDGTITVQTTGGTNPINYNLQPTNQTNLSGSFTNLAANTYTVTATDLNGCSVQTQLTIAEPTVLSWTSATGTDITCNGGSDGTITSQATGGTGSINYTLQPTNQTNTTGSYSNLAANTYTITATDQNGCTTTTQVTISEPSALTWLSTASTSVSCNGGNDGAITGQTTGGTGTINYLLQPTNQSSTSVSYNNLTAGTYTITATDQNGCTTTTQVTVTEPSPLQITNIASTNPTCVPGNDGSLTVSATGGTTNYQYSLNGGIQQASNTFSNLGSGVYTIQVSDANGCTATSTQNISAPNAPSFTTATSTDVSCNGGNDGTITVQTTGGTNPINYNLQPTNQTNLSGSFTNLAANTYTVTATDLNGCSVQTQLTIAEPVILNWTSATGTDITCNGGSDGTITSQATGGTGSINYTLQPTNQTNTTGSYSNLAANTYTITATDQNGCTTTTQVTISEPTPLSWTSATATNVSCNGGTDGTITSQAIGGTGSINYTLQPTNQTNTTGSYSNLAANTYTITATDQNGCTTTTQVTVTEPLPLQITNIASTNPTCVPGNDGSLTVSATGGTTNYQYSLNGGIQQASNTFSNLGSGVYTIQVSDANGCTATSTQNISAPNAPLITSVQVLDAGCDPGNDGSITITASGGTPGYTYSSNGAVFQGSSLLSGLTAGTYTVVVQDAIGCQGSSVVNIGTQPSPSVAVGTITDATCIPGCDGTAQFSASGGTSPTYTYSINNGLSFQANSLFNGICAGNYTVTVKDGNGCTGTTLFAISTVNGPSFTSASSTDVLCNGTNTGTISSTLIGGTLPINYNLQPINLNNGTGQFTSLNANTYTLNASDANGCIATTVVTVAEPPLLQFANVNMNGSLCNGNSNGSIDVSTTGGTPSITYTITPSATFSPPSSFINLLGNTTYTIQATDANGCSITTSITVTQPQALSYTQAQATDVICNGQSNGQISTTAIGGTGLLTYDLMPGSVNNTIGVFTGLNAGAYTVTVTDINNCTLTTTLQIAEPPAIVIDTILVQNETCNNALNGSISVSASGGFGMLTYTLLPINVSNPVGTFSGLAGNTYTVVISDANACTYTTQVIVINPATVQWDSTNSSGVLCNGGNTGSIQVAASGGTGLITYTLQPNSITNTTGLFANLSAGQFTITAMDVNNCTASTIIVVSEPLPLQGNLVSKTDLTCHNANDGTLTVSANGGVTPYTYTLQPTLVNNTTGVFANLAGGIYSVTITDSNLCTAVVNNITIINPTQVDFTQVLHEDIKCYGDPAGSITVQAAGGVGAINYSLQPNLGTQATSGVFNGLPAGVYTVTASDGNNCSTNTVIAIIQNPQIVITNVEYREPTCWGDADGSMDISAVGGVGSLSYQLNIGNPQPSGYFTNLLASGYLITIRDTLGCTMDTTLVLTQPEPVHFSSLDPQPVYCVGASNGKIIVKGSGGRGGYKYYLRPGLFINTSGVFSGLHEGLYTLTIKDSAGCHFDTVISIQPPLNPFSITTTQKNLGCYGTGIEGWAEVITQGGDAPYTYLWSTSPVQNTPRAENLTFGYYFVEVTDGNGCIDKDTVYIEPGPCCEEVFIPNAFSPNGDGNNDVFRITTSAGIELIQLEVFNRWGNKVWSTNDFRSGWDGKYLGQDETLNTYYYVFRYKCLTDGQNYIKKGDLILMR